MIAVGEIEGEPEFEIVTGRIGCVRVKGIAAPIAVLAQAAALEQRGAELLGQIVAFAFLVSGADQQAELLVRPGEGGDNPALIAVADLRQQVGMLALHGLLGDDVDDRAQAIVAVELGLQSAGDLDACDLLGGDKGRVELAVGGIVEGHAVYEQLDVARAPAAHVDARRAIGAGGDVDTGLQFDRLVERPRPATRHVLARQFAHRAGLLDHRLSARDHDLAELVGLRVDLL